MPGALPSIEDLARLHDDRVGDRRIRDGDARDVESVGSTVDRPAVSDTLLELAAARRMPACRRWRRAGAADRGGIGAGARAGRAAGCQRRGRSDAHVTSWVILHRTISSVRLAPLNRLDDVQLRRRAAAASWCQDGLHRCRR